MRAGRAAQGLLGRVTLRRCRLFQLQLTKSSCLQQPQFHRHAVALRAALPRLHSTQCSSAWSCKLAAKPQLTAGGGHYARGALDVEGHRL